MSDPEIQADVPGVPAPETAPEAPATDPLREAQDQLLRLRADFDNFRKRTRREKEEWTQRSLENICGDLITVIDHFELGLANARQTEVPEAVVHGFQLVHDQLRNILGKYGLQGVDAEGAFDPNLHEAVTHVASDEVPAQHVLAMTRRGYRLGERLLRPVQVVVSSGPAAASAGGQD
jgi:molecular chaperone GrpE